MITVVYGSAYGEDACRVTTPSAAINLAALRNLSILVIRLAGGKVKAMKAFRLEVFEDVPVKQILASANAAHTSALALNCGRAPTVIT